MVWEDQPTEVEANESESTAVPPQCLKEGKPPRRGCACVAAECPLKRHGSLAASEIPVAATS